MVPPAAKSLSCSHCDKVFGRNEHLKRHERSHTNERQFSCATCGKQFSRRDAVQRHEATHRATSPSLLSKGARACTQCAAAKVRCTGGAQCFRCRQRALRCSYPDVFSEHDATAAYVGGGESEMSSDHVVESVQPQVIPTVPQTLSFNALQVQAPLTYDSSVFEPDFWNPNMLLSTNWLNDVVDSSFQDMPFDFDTFGHLTHGSAASAHLFDGRSALQSGRPIEQPLLTEVGESPFAVASNISAPSTGSTETAAEVCAAQESSPNKRGEYYVDGEPARLPKTKRRKSSSKQISQEGASQQTLLYSLKTPLPADADLKHRICIPNEAHLSFIEMWQRTCQGNMLPWPQFETAEFPTKEFFEHLLGLYFASFHPTCPFMHPASFNAHQADWLLVLAMTAIGARYLNDDYSNSFAMSLQELLRRCLLYLNEDPSWIVFDALTLAQVRILHAIGMVYSGNSRLVQRGLDMQQSFITIYARLIKECSESANVQVLSDEHDWESWIHQEQRIRTAYFIWLLDSMWSYQFQRCPYLGLSDAMLPLPCHDKLWNATHAEEWKALSPSYRTAPTLPVSLQELYIDKRMPKDRGEFARVLMIHGLFQRTWEAGRYFGNPISQWEPTAEKQSSAEILPSAPIWLPSIHAYAKWQNSVCDCLDILHWQANATIGQASGFEHPTVAFLHLARVILLSPIDSIVRLAKFMSGLEQGTSTTLAHDTKLVQRWAVQGQYKARLAAIHAGVVFWHVRRYSVDGFYEAPAIGLAALMLWAFGTFSIKPDGTQQRQTANGQNGASHSDEHESQDGSSEDSSYGIILLDRPADDEIVQQFIRHGHTMHAHIAGGDLYDCSGPSRVLVLGCKLLKTLKCWDANIAWHEILERLIEAINKQT